MVTTDIDRHINVTGATGYLHPMYAESLAEFGIPRELPRSKAWILERQIPDSPYHDAMGCYPLFACQDWSQLCADLEDLVGELVSLALVAVPFGKDEITSLRDCFRDVAIPFKQHFIVDLGRPLETFIHPHHRRYARKARRELYVERCAEPLNFLEAWIALYSTLVEKHRITGIAVFSKESFAKQLAVPGIVAFRAVHNEATVGMLLWYVQGNVAYYHLGAYNARGYELRASFALFSYSIEYFARHGFGWLNLGGGAGASANGTSGLSRFKEGWSNGTRTAYFCGRVLDQKKYQEIINAKSIPATDYFPAYRVGEFQ